MHRRRGRTGVVRTSGAASAWTSLLRLGCCMDPGETPAGALRAQNELPSCSKLLRSHAAPLLVF